MQGPNKARWGYLNPLVADWDGDDLLDVITNDNHGRYLWYRNAGSHGGAVRRCRAAALRASRSPRPGGRVPRPGADSCLPLLNRDGNLLRGCGPGGLWGRTAFCVCDWDLDGTGDLVAATSAPRGGTTWTATEPPTCSAAPRSARSTPGATPTLRRDWGPATRFATGPVTTTSGYGVVIAVDPARGGPTPTR